jgi:hypothetical protein
MKPTILKMLDISTMHVSKETRQLLDTPDEWSMEHSKFALETFPGMFRDSEGHGWLYGGGRHVLTVPFQYGWIVYAHDDQLDLPVAVPSSAPSA